MLEAVLHGKDRKHVTQVPGKMSVRAKLVRGEQWMSGGWVPMGRGPCPTSHQGRPPKSGTHIPEMARRQATWEMVKTLAERGLMNAGAQGGGVTLKKPEFQKAVRRPKL